VIVSSIQKSPGKNREGRETCKLKEILGTYQPNVIYGLSFDMDANKSSVKIIVFGDLGNRNTKKICCGWR
jgi:hypothetical protein